LQRLEIPYRVIVLCTGDMGFGQSKTYDLEAWSPAKSASSSLVCSNYNDFQRAGQHPLPAQGREGRLCSHAERSGLALPRTVVAILENYQQRTAHPGTHGAAHLHGRVSDVIR